MATVSKVVYDKLQEDVNMTAAFNGVYYDINDNKVNYPYASIFIIDDPEDIANLCVSQQGRARFQCDVFTNNVLDGVNKRLIFKTAMKAFANTTTNTVKIMDVQNINTVDRSNTINDLYQLSFESLVRWEIA